MKKTQKVILFRPGTKRSRLFDFLMSKKGEDLELFVFFILKGKDFLDLKTSVIHRASHTSGLTYVYGVLYDMARVNHEGLIRIGPKAKMTNAYLKCNILLVGESTKANCTPSLEIENNEVKASHGVTIGRFDQDLIFYMRSRGLSQEEAYELAISGFFEPIIEKISSLKERGHVRKLLSKAL